MDFLKKHPYVLKFYLGLFYQNIISGEELSLIIDNLDILIEEVQKNFREKTFHSIVKEAEQPTFAENFVNEMLREWNKKGTPLALKIKEAAFVFMTKAYKEKNIASNRVNPTLIGYYGIFMKAIWLS